MTHDISEIKNITELELLFIALPLNRTVITCDIDVDPDAPSSITITYYRSVADIDEEKVHRDTIYNCIAAMAKFNELTTVTFIFPDIDITFHRSQIEAQFDIPLSELLAEETWGKKVQSQLTSTDFMEQFFDGNS